MSGIVITAAKRTPIGTFMGALKNTPAVDLGVIVARSILTHIKHQDVTDVIVGNVLQAGQGMNPGRQIALKSGLPSLVPGQTVNRVCGSGMQAIISAVQSLKAGDGRVYLAGGSENMSRAPYIVNGIRSGHKLGNMSMIDSLQNEGLTDALLSCQMGITAETIAHRWKIDRAQQDSFAAESHRRAAEAIAKGIFQNEIVPVELATKTGIGSFVQDEHVRPETTVEILAKLKPVFEQDTGTVTAGNSSGINDGAALLTITTDDYAIANNLPILAEILGYGVSGVDPEIMGFGPVRAIPAALKHAGISIDAVDLFEINEAFAAQSLAVIHDLNLDCSKVNVYGGAIALGHPIGASGARIVVTLINALHNREKTVGVASLCIGGGMGIALVIRVPWNESHKHRS